MSTVVSTALPLPDLAGTPSEIDFLKQVPLFASLEPEELQDVASQLTLRQFPAGMLIFQAGDPGTELFIVRKGIVRIFTEHDGSEFELTRLVAGEFFGDLALLDGAPRAASAAAKVDTSALVLTRERLLDLLDRRPRAAVTMLGVQAGRIRAADHKLRNLASKNVNDEAEENRTVAQRASDAVATFGGSWRFVMLFLGLNLAWMILNTTRFRPDPYPFIFLNLILTLLTTMVAPFIMMSQARQASKDRLRSDLDFKVNLKNETAAEDIKETLEELCKLDVPRQLGYMRTGDPAEPMAPPVRK